MKKVAEETAPFDSPHASYGTWILRLYLFLALTQVANSFSLSLPGKRRGETLKTADVTTTSVSRAVSMTDSAGEEGYEPKDAAPSSSDCATPLSATSALQENHDYPTLPLR